MIKRSHAWSWMLVCALLLATSHPSMSSSGSASAEQLVRDSATAISRLHSYELNVITNRSISDGTYIRTFHEYFETSFEQSGAKKRIRMVSRQPADTMTIVSDGRGYWIYHESNRRYEHKDGSLPSEVYQGATPGFSHPLSATELPAAMKSARILRQETLELEGRHETCDVLEVLLKPNVAPPDYQIENDKLTIWLSRQYRIPMKLSATFLHRENGKSQRMEMSIVVEKFQPNIALPGSTWVFQPPANSQSK
jgi:outer membrane lipoprotein-sorting protein